MRTFYGFTHRVITVLLLLIVSIFDSKAQPLQYYFGNLHSHSFYSDGNKANNPAYNTLAPCYQFASNSSDIDFWGISDHNHSGAGMHLSDFRNGVHECDSVNGVNGLTTLYGIEFGEIATGGHVVVYGIDSLIGWETGNYDIYNAQTAYGDLFNKVASRTNAIATLAHMDTVDYNNLVNQNYNAVWDTAICGVALRNGPAFSTNTGYANPSTSDYVDRFMDVLAKGYHPAPVMDQDNHYITFGRVNNARTVILAPNKSRTALLQAVRSRHCYASDDANAMIDFRVNNSIMGSIVSGAGNANIAVSCTDPDGEQVYSITVYYGISGNGIRPSPLITVYNTSVLNYSVTQTINQPYYYYAEIVQADGNHIWSAPVWYKQTAISGVQEMTVNNFSLFPVYVDRSRKLNISFLNPDKIAIDLNIYNATGVIISSLTISGFASEDPVQVNALSWSAGLYIVTARDSRGMMHSQKIIIN